MSTENPFASKSTEELCNTDIRRFSDPQMMSAFHRELIVRKEKLEKKLIELGVNPQTLHQARRGAFKQTASLLANVDKSLSNLNGST